MPPTLVMLSGAIGSGKSTLAHDLHVQCGFAVVSSDSRRAAGLGSELPDCIAAARAELEAGKDVVMDRWAAGTGAEAGGAVPQWMAVRLNIDNDVRQRIASDLGKAAGRVMLVVLDPDLDVINERLESRIAGHSQGSTGGCTSGPIFHLATTQHATIRSFLNGPDVIENYGASWMVVADAATAMAGLRAWMGV
ncbi:MAG: hypothetical protein J3K34DRAFT_522635 [Monoraphidium minutum]|nr:MAG: hypothetical protein J3K34DRAFT_522635 [Monoraphidium minutum]